MTQLKGDEVARGAAGPRLALGSESLPSLYSSACSSVPGVQFVDAGNGVLGIECDVQFLLGSGDEGEDSLKKQITMMWTVW
jgi:hypothetical protein